MKFPDTSDMLPSAARQAVFDFFFLARLEASELNYYGDPMYYYATALGEMPILTHSWVYVVSHEQFCLAEAEYDRRHPKNRNSKGTRERK